jgi:outer membrane lipoprotein-sorting protein
MNFSMRKILRFGLAALALAVFFNAFAASEAKGQQINELLKRMEAYRLRVTSLESNLTMIKYDPVIKKSDVTQGKLKYAAVRDKKGKDVDAAIRIDWVKPEEILSVVKGKYVLYRPRLRQYIEGKADAKNAKDKGGDALKFMNMSKKELQANYSVQYLGEEKLDGGQSALHLQLTPKTASKYKVAEVWVDTDGRIHQFQVTMQSGDYTAFRLTNIKENVNFPSTDFIVNTNGAKRIEG